MDLPLPFLGDSNVYPVLVSESVRLTRSVPVSRFTSSHFRLSNSPSLKPQCTASTYRASNLSPRAASRNVRACSGLRGVVSFFLGLGGLMPSATLRGTSPSDTASFKALCSVECMYCTVRRLSPRVQLLAVKPTDVSGGEGLELDTSQRRFDMNPRYLLVALPSAL